MSSSSSLGFPERIWGSLAADYIVHLPKTKDTSDAIPKWFDRLTRRLRLIKRTTTDIAMDVANVFFSVIISQHGFPGTIVSDQYSKFTPELDFCKNHMD